MSLSVQVTGTQELQRYQQLMQTLGDPKHKTELLDALGDEVVSQTTRRIHDEKSSPDGQPWAEWNSAYAKTVHGNQSLLQAGGDLLDSIQYVVEKNQVRIGSPLAYAAVHQDGFSGAVQVDAHTRLITQAFGKAIAPRSQFISSFSRLMNIPQREFLGLSTDNQQEIYAVLGNFWEGLIQ